MAHGSRQRASVRFDPYWKVQFWLPRSYSWQDVQLRYEDEDEARAAAQSTAAEKRVKCRLMLITMDGRGPVPDSEVSP